MTLTRGGGRLSVTREGLGLHHGAPARVTLTAAQDPVETTLNGAPLHHWSAVRAERSTAITCDTMRARTIEHLLAALAGLGLHRGVEIRLEGEEPPILDGAAAEWMDAAASLAVAPGPAGLAVARGATIDVGTSRYMFAPGDRVGLSVELEVADPRIRPHADWQGDPADFRARIAPARTFCFAHEVEELARAGLASHVKPEIVIVIGPAEILAAGQPFEADEPARHKLLDLAGDLFLYGGPPRGSVVAYRPGHWATHEAVRIARASGVLVPVPSAGGSG